MTPAGAGDPNNGQFFVMDAGTHYNVTFSTTDGSPMTDKTVAAIESLGGALVEAGGSSGVFTVVQESDQVLNSAPTKLGDQTVAISNVEEA